jgi:hypothetical protein
MGNLAPSGAPVHARIVKGALCAVGQVFSTLGQQDPCLLSSGKLDLCLSRQLSAYRKCHPPHSTRVKPIPFCIIAQAMVLCHHANALASNTIANMLLLGFLFLLCPGECAYMSNPDADPFRSCDIHLLIHDHCIHPLTATEADLNTINYITLELTTQKNGVQGKLVGLGKTGHPIHCPVKALLNCIHHL